MKSRPATVLLRSFRHELQPHMAQQRGLEPPILFRGHPLSKRADYHYHTAAYGSGSWNRTNLSWVRTRRPTDERYRYGSRAGQLQGSHQSHPAQEREGSAQTARWRRGWASNPQASLQRPPVFGTGWHSHLPSPPSLIAGVSRANRLRPACS